MKLTEHQKSILESSQAAKGHVYASPHDADAIQELVRMQLVRTIPIVPSSISMQRAVLIGRGWWPVWAIEHFPSVASVASADEDALRWDPLVRAYSLHRKVLVVMKTRIEGTWNAYCAPVPGTNHEDEKDEVLRHGDKVSEEVARKMFGEMDGIPYAQ